MADYLALKSELASDPSGLGYASMTDAQIVAAINAATQPGPAQLVPITEIIGYLFQQAAPTGSSASNLWLAIVTSTVPAAVEAVAYFNNVRAVEVDVTLPKMTSILSDVVSAGLLTAAQSAVIVSMSATKASRASLIGWQRYINVGDIAVARAK
jgi:hypothetical protein